MFHNSSCGWKAMPLKRWSTRVDKNADIHSRWHSANAGLAHTPDAIGDHLIAALRDEAKAVKDDMAIAVFARELKAQLERYEQEPRLLIKLSETGRIGLLLQRAVSSALGVLNQAGTPAAYSWHQYLTQERKERVERYKVLISSGKLFDSEARNTDQSLEILMLIKHCFDQYSAVLTSDEVKLMSNVFDAVVFRGNVVPVSIPDWFATSEQEWSRAEVTLVEGEETCVREASIWSKLHHPNIRKFFGACCVGSPFMIHEGGYTFAPSRMTWERLLGCARGLKYVHECGLEHRELSVENLLYSFFLKKGILSGMGLKRYKTGSVDHESWRYAGSADIVAFGRMVFDILVQIRRPNELKVIEGPLPTTCPDFVEQTEWEWIRKLCGDGTSMRLEMMDIVCQLEVFSRQELPIDANMNPLLSRDDTLWTTLEENLTQIGILCTGLEDFQAVNMPVYARLTDVYTQLKGARILQTTSLVEDFHLILLRFIKSLEMRSDQCMFGSDSMVASICASHTLAEKNYSLHFDIDRLLRSSPTLKQCADVHQWQSTWKKTRTRHEQKLKSCFAESKSHPGDSEVMTLRHFHAHNTRDVPKTTELSSWVGNVLPPWFIPSYQVELGQHIADGSFGAVYFGKWLGTDVVVKRLSTDRPTRANREQFQQEADLWFTLNHTSLLKMYGACHEGWPFFVCELASHGTLGSFLKGKHRKSVWESLYWASRGLQHLHDRGIVHADLKGNNILVCENSVAKLADFGLSKLVTKSHVDGIVPTGAVRWKAPEVLLGGAPAFAADIFSYGMCIIEAVTGQCPWGTSIPDSVVKDKVANGELPRRPESFTDAEWKLVQNMCRLDPQQRIDAGAVVNGIWNCYVKIKQN